jgi:2-aminoadipate transaminase
MSFRISRIHGRLLALDRRLQLVEWAARRDVLIVEDDPYGSLYFEDVVAAGETRPLKADDPEGRVLYLSTFSKTLAPGFRVGWMVAPPSLIDRFETAKQSTDLTSGILDQHVVYEAVKRGVVHALAPSSARCTRASAT